MLLTIPKSDFKKFIDTFPNWIAIDYTLNLPQETISYFVDDNFIRDLRIELDRGDQTNYTTMLIRLLFKAHGSNFDKLLIAYPREALTVWSYQNCEEFYKQLE